jgi:hypothetical protein
MAPDLYAAELRRLRAETDQLRIELETYETAGMRTATSGRDTTDEKIAQIKREIASVEQRKRTLIAEQVAWEAALAKGPPGDPVA